MLSPFSSSPMQISSTRISTAMTCWEKARLRFHSEEETGTSLGAIQGTAFHAAVAVGISSNWKEAYEVAFQEYDKQIDQLTLLPGESFLVDEGREVLRKMVECYEEHYDQKFTTLQPECRFRIPLGDPHNTITVHWLEEHGGQIVEKWNHRALLQDFNQPTPQTIEIKGVEVQFQQSTIDPLAILERRVKSPHPVPDPTCPCYLPHHLVGITDAIVQYNAQLYLLEHKTTSSTSKDDFFRQFHLDIQPALYVLGVYRSLGIRPAGVILNAVFKPTENMVRAWQSRSRIPKQYTDYITFGRELIPISDEDLERAERLVINWAGEWESRILSGNFPHSLTRDVCAPTPWRRCYFWDTCLGHQKFAILQSYREAE